jgi:hypothetical protein
MVDSLTHADWGLHLPANVTSLVNASKQEVEVAMEEFFADASSDDQLFFYFSGHGIHELYERLFLAVSDTVSGRPLSTAVSFQLLNELTASTRAAATAIVIDCCHSGIMKGPSPSFALDSRGRWTLSSSRRDQLSSDARTPDTLSAFTHLVCEGLVANAEVDADADGYVTMADLNHYVSPRLDKATGQTTTFAFEGSGDLVVALAPGYDVEFDQARSFAELAGSKRIAVPEIPAPDPRVAAEYAISSSVGSSADAMERSDDPASDLLRAIEEGRDITARRLLQEQAKDALRRVESADGWPGLGTALDGLACMAASLLNHHLDGWLEESVRALVAVYEGGFDSRGIPKQSGQVAGGVTPAELWLGVFERVEALGAVAVRTGQWNAVRTLAMQRPDGLDFRHYNNWLRHAVTMAARANLNRVEVNGRFEDRSFLMASARLVEDHECLRQDLYRADEDRILTSLCQFDALACVAAIVEAGSLHDGSFYPSFARFHAHRAESAFSKLLSDPELRSAIAPVSDEELAVYLRGLSEAASKEGMRFDGWWGFNDGEIVDFLREHPER